MSWRPSSLLTEASKAGAFAKILSTFLSFLFSLSFQGIIVEPLLHSAFSFIFSFPHLFCYDKDVERQGEGSSWFSSFALSRSLWLWCHLDGEQVPWLVLQGQRDPTQPSGWGADDQKLIGAPTVFPSQCSGYFPCGLRGSAVGLRPNNWSMFSAFM